MVEEARRGQGNAFGQMQTTGVNIAILMVLTVFNLGNVGETHVQVSIENSIFNIEVLKKYHFNETKILLFCLIFDLLVDGAWGPWDNWNSCSSSCGGGRQSKIRLCDSPLPASGGALCTSHEIFLLSVTKDGTLKETDTQTCNNNNCPTTTEPTTLPQKGTT